MTGKIKVVLLSAVSHLNHHRALVAVLILMMSIVFFTQLLLVGFFDQEDATKRSNINLLRLTYECSSREANKEQVERFLSEIQGYRGIISDVILCSSIVPGLMENAEGNTTVQSGSASDIKPVYVLSFFPSRSEKRMLRCIQGRFVLSNNKQEIFLSDHLRNQALLIDGFFARSSSLTGVVLMIDGQEWECVGVGELSGIPENVSPGYLVVDYSLLFSVVEKCDGVLILFSRHPNEVKLEQINQIAARCFPEATQLVPVHRNLLGSDFFTHNGTTIIVILILVANVLSLFEHMLYLRKMETQIYRLLGARRSVLPVIALVELIIVALISIVISGIIALTQLGDIIFGSITDDIQMPSFLVNAALFFLIVMIGFALRMIFERRSEAISLYSGG